MKKSKFLILIPLLLCCGWTGKYNLEVKNDTFYENVSLDFGENIEKLIEKYKSMADGDFIETTVFYDDIFAVENEKKYKKEINNSIVNLNANYTFKEFTQAKYLNNCFKNFELKEDRLYFYINISGDFGCKGLGISELNLKTKNKVEGNYLINNSEKNSYYWKILDTNNNIEVKIRKDIDLTFLILAFLAIVLFTFAVSFMLRYKRINKI